MEEPITNELEYVFSLLRDPPDDGDHEWGEVMVYGDRDIRVTRTMSHDVVLEQRELNNKCARRILDVFYDVSREFTHIDLGLID